MPFAPRLDADGNEFLYLPVNPVGMMLFMNREPVAHARRRPAPIGRVELGRIDDPTYIDPGGNGRFLMHGAVRAGGTEALLEVDTITDEVRELLTTSDDIEGLPVEDFTPAKKSGYGTDGVPVLTVNSLLPAVVTPDRVLAHTGDIIDGIEVRGIQHPRRAAGEAGYFTAEGHAFRVPFQGAGERRRGLYDLVAGQVLFDVVDLEDDSTGALAYCAELTADRRGVFVDARPVAIPGVSRINGALVTWVRGDGFYDSVAINDYGQVAFLARVSGGLPALYVATPRRPFDANGDCFVDESDLELFFSCRTGPGVTPSPECIEFDVLEDCFVDLRDFLRLQERYTGGEEPEGGCRPAKP